MSSPAHAGPYDGFKAHELGVLRLIEKPSSPDEIANALWSAVAGATKYKADHSSITNYCTEQPVVRVQLPARPLGRRTVAAVAYIEMHFTDVNLSVVDVANQVDVTPEHLARLFQELLGRKPLIVINDLRIRRAQHFLTDPRLNRGEIAALCGYRSTRQLNGWYKFFYGHRPHSRGPKSRVPLLMEHQETDPNIS